MPEITHEAVTAQLKSLAAELTERREALESELATTTAQLKSTLAAIEAMEGKAPTNAKPRKRTKPRGQNSHRTNNSSSPQCVVANIDGQKVAYPSKTEALKAMGLASGTFYAHTTGLDGEFNGKTWTVVPDIPANGMEVFDGDTGLSYATMRDAAIGAGVTRTAIALDITSDEARRFSLVGPDDEWQREEDEGTRQ